MKKEKKVLILSEGQLEDVQRNLGEVALEYARQHPDEFNEFLKRRNPEQGEKRWKKKK
ncbi:MAG: hypothetical protein ABII85_01680 [Bacillota bacterium]